MVNRVMRKSFYITLILVGVLVPVVNAYADGDTTDFSITVNPSLNLSVSKSVTGFTLTPSKNGSYDSDGFNVTSSTNNATGYTLIMSVDDTDLVSETINVNTGDPLTIPTLTKTQDGITAAQFEASTDSSVLNHYGISIAGANYNAMESPKTILETSENNATSDVTAISLAAKLDLLTVPAIYSTTINFALTANPVTPSIPFINPDPDPTKPTVHPCVKMGDLECDDTDDDGVGDSLVFPANSLLRTYEIAYTNAGKPMYVEDSNTDIGWRPMVDADLATIGGKEVRFAIQDIAMTLDDTVGSDKVCSAAASSLADNSYIDIAEVMDLRDGTSYHIVKAADNRCWLADNLALDITDSAVQNRMNDFNTNASQEMLGVLFNGGRIDGDSSTDGYATSGVTASAFDYNYDIPTIGKKQVNMSEGDLESPDDTFVDGFGWKFGIYYNYCAASAGSYCYGAGSSYDTAYDRPGTSVDAQYDICPYGWRMPTNGPIDSTDHPDGGEYISTYYAYQSVSGGESRYSLIRKSFRYPLAGVLSAVDNYDMEGNNSKIWSSTYGTNSNMLYFQVGLPEYIMPAGAENRYLGYSVRCIAK